MEKKITIKEDKGFHSPSGFKWFNIEKNNTRIGKARIRIAGQTVIVNSINIYSEFERHGYARRVIDYLKERYAEIIADRVRYTAVGFWEKMCFQDEHNGNYVWKAEN